MVVWWELYISCCPVFVFWSHNDWCLNSFQPANRDIGPSSLWAVAFFSFAESCNGSIFKWTAFYGGCDSIQFTLLLRMIMSMLFWLISREMMSMVSKQLQQQAGRLLIWLKLCNNFYNPLACQVNILAFRLLFIIVIWFCPFLSRTFSFIHIGWLHLVFIRYFVIIISINLSVTGNQFIYSAISHLFNIEAIFIIFFSPDYQI